VTRSLAIDLNCDMGEDEAPACVARDLALLDVVSSANIACGGHAGSDDSMRRLVQACRSRGVRIGAHPGYEDRARLGRVELDLAPDAIRRCVALQVARLATIAREFGTVVTHVKPHGALYHAAMRRPEIADAVMLGAAETLPEASLVGLAGAMGTRRWEAAGRRVEHEAFADRRYEADGSLRARTAPGAVLEDPAHAATQAESIASGRGVPLDDGGRLAVAATTLCIHSDSPGSLAIAAAVAAAITKGQITKGQITDES
jgi:UPF0271 protein